MTEPDNLKMDLEPNKKHVLIKMQRINYLRDAPIKTDDKQHVVADN